MSGSFPPAEDAAGEEEGSPVMPDGELGNLNEDDLPTAADSRSPVSEEPDSQSEQAPVPSGNGPEAQSSQPPGSHDPPALVASEGEPTSALSTKPWRGSARKILAIILAVLVVAGSGAAFYVLSPLRPVLSVSGPRQVGATPAGSPDQVLHVSGRGFSTNSAITFLLDGAAAPGAPQVKSDGSGTFSANLPITDEWLIGSHMLTAKDARGNSTRTATPVQVLPAPVITIISVYHQGATPAGSSGTALSVSGKRFALHSTIQFSIDGAPLPTPAPVTSDKTGKVAATWELTGDWALGTHTLTATDAQGNTTASGAALVIVHQGEAGTPGPNGAPADDTSFSITIKLTERTPGSIIFLHNQLQIIGQPDPAGGTVCGADDDGQPHTLRFVGFNGGDGTSTETTSYACSGTYKSGHLTYTETVVSIVFQFSDGSTCTGGGYTIRQLEGTFSSATTMSGTASYPSSPLIPCSGGSAIFIQMVGAPDSTWTGTVEAGSAG